LAVGDLIADFSGPRLFIESAGRVLSAWRQETASDFPPSISCLVSCKSSLLRGFSAGPRRCRRSRASPQRARGLPPPFMVRSGRRRGNFQL